MSMAYLIRNGLPRLRVFQNCGTQTIIIQRSIGTTLPRLEPDQLDKSDDKAKPKAEPAKEPKVFKIYTRTGDKGTSALFTGERRPKNDRIFDALGCTDELSSHIAVAREYALEERHPFAEQLRRIQCILQDVSSLIATPKSSARESHLSRVGFSQRHADELEEWIDEYSAKLPPLTNFILPGGGKSSASLHVARTVCRRAERYVAPLVRDGETDKQALIYLNRLSDFLFTAARIAAKLDGREETIYVRPDNPKKAAV
jgi:cob(I)alamin adenosyltransferase